MATQPIYPTLTVEEFLAIDFAGRKAELDNGTIRLMAGGSMRHSRVASRILAALDRKLIGTGCTPYNADIAIRTRNLSIRYPDVTVYCGRDGPENDNVKAADDPRVIFEVLSAGTARTDLGVKLDEYKELSSVDTVVFVDIAAERLRVVRRTGPDAWSEIFHREPVDLILPMLGIALTHDDIFARA